MVQIAENYRVQIPERYRVAVALDKYYIPACVLLGQSPSAIEIRRCESLQDVANLTADRLFLLSKRQTIGASGPDPCQISVTRFPGHQFCIGSSAHAEHLLAELQSGEDGDTLQWIHEQLQ